MSAMMTTVGANLPDHPQLSTGVEPSPWVGASELQCNGGKFNQKPLDELDEALMESFPCSDPPCHGRRDDGFKDDGYRDDA